MNINDPCSFAVGSIFRHIYDWFVTTENPFVDEFKPVPIVVVVVNTKSNGDSSSNSNPLATNDASNENEGESNQPHRLKGKTNVNDSNNGKDKRTLSTEDDLEQKEHSNNSNESSSAVSTWDRDEFHVCLQLNNARIVLLRDLHKRDCDAIMTHGDTQYIYDWCMTPDVLVKSQQVSLNNFGLHFAKGNDVKLKGHAELIQPSKFHYHSLRTINRLNEDQIYKQNLSLDSIVIKGITSNLAAALKDVAQRFTSNWYDNCCDYLFPKPTTNVSVTKIAEATDEKNVATKHTYESELHVVHHEKGVTDEATSSTTTRSQTHYSELPNTEHRQQRTELFLNVDLNRMEIYVHDENYEQYPAIFRMGFTDLHVRSHSNQPNQRTIEATMLWHGSKFDEKNNNPSPLVCPWQCSIHVAQGIDPELQVDVCDIRIYFVLPKKKNSIYVYMDVPSSRGDPEQKTSEKGAIPIHKSQRHNGPAIDALPLKGQTRQPLVKCKVSFLVPHFSLYLERPSLNLTIGKIEAQAFHVMFTSDTVQDTVQIKTKYIGLRDYVQQAGKSFEMLMESTHNMRDEFFSCVGLNQNKHTHTKKRCEFFGGTFPKRQPVGKEPRNVLEFKLDTLTVNYNAECILHLVMFFKSVQKITKLAEEKGFHSGQRQSTDLSLSPKTNKVATEKDDSVTLKVLYKFQQLNICLNKPHRMRHVVQFSLAETNISYCLFGDHSHTLEGEIGNLTALDLTNEGKDVSPFSVRNPTILGLADTSNDSNSVVVDNGSRSNDHHSSHNKVLLKFSYIVSLFDTTNCRYQTQLQASISSVKFVYHNLLVMEIMDYVQSGVVGLFAISSKADDSNEKEVKHLWSPTPALKADEKKYDFDLPDPNDSEPLRSVLEHADSPDMDTAIRYSITINKPVITFPFHRTSENSIDLDLGSIYITNQVRMDTKESKRKPNSESALSEEKTKDNDNNDNNDNDNGNEVGIFVEDICIQMEHVQLSGGQSRQVQMLEMSIHTMVTRGLSYNKVLEPNYQVITKIDEFRVCLSQQHCKDIMTTVFGNFSTESEVFKSRTISSTHLEGMKSFQTIEAKNFASLTKDSGRDALEDTVDQINAMIQARSKKQVQKYENEIKSDRRGGQSQDHDSQQLTDKPLTMIGQWTKEQALQIKRLKELEHATHLLSVAPVNVFLNEEIQKDVFCGTWILIATIKSNRPSPIFQ
ncbi:hypothetical protein RFI_07679, partial [Reticulomyxa filosa]